MRRDTYGSALPAQPGRSQGVGHPLARARSSSTPARTWRAPGAPVPDGSTNAENSAAEIGRHRQDHTATNMLERLNWEIKLRTPVVRILPNPQNCLRVVMALAVETNEKLGGGQPLHQLKRICAGTRSSLAPSHMTSFMAAPFCRT